MKTASNTHIYVGIGTAVVLIGGALLIKQIQKKQDTKLKKKMDLSVFDSPDKEGSGSCINADLLTKLKALEQQTSYPIFSWINSAVRTAYWNQKVGGVNNSSHQIPKCAAVDIKAANLHIRNELVNAAKAVGFKRIGVGKTFVHLDVDSSKSQYVAWGYPKGVRPAINPFL